MRWFCSLLLLLSIGVAVPAFAGNTAPDFTLRNLNNEAVTLSSLKGKVVLMAFWATWCAPCKSEMPHLQKMFAEKGAKGLVVLGISADDASKGQAVRAVVNSVGVKYPVLLDVETKVVSLYNPSKTLPFTVIVDRVGAIVESHSGYNAGDEVELGKKLDALLEAKAP